MSDIAEILSHVDARNTCMQQRSRLLRSRQRRATRGSKPSFRKVEHPCTYPQQIPDVHSGASPNASDNGDNVIAGKDDSVQSSCAVHQTSFRQKTPNAAPPDELAASSHDPRSLVSGTLGLARTLKCSPIANTHEVTGHVAWWRRRNLHFRRLQRHHTTSPKPFFNHA
jgi:hypothetical protein